MINIQNILRRSWHVLWNYRTLWIFGFILAVALGGNNTGNNFNYRLNDDQRNVAPGQVPDFWDGPQGNTFAEVWNDLLGDIQTGLQRLQAEFPVEFRMGVTAVIIFLVVAVLLGILMTILRYVAETASIRMVDEYEQSGVKVGFRQGWRYGWSRASWRLFLVNFVVHLPVLLLFVILGLVGWWVFSALMSGIESAIINSAIAGIGLAFLFIFITIVVMVVLLVLRDIAWRMIVLDGAGAMQSLRMAAAMVGRQWRSVGLMWLVVVGLKIAWGLAFFILVFPLLILSIITAMGGLVAAIVPTLLTAGVSALLSAPDYWPWIFAAIIAMPIFFVVTFSPIFLVSGWGQIYQSSLWTLTYRELKALETVAPEVA